MGYCEICAHSNLLNAYFGGDILGLGVGGLQLGHFQQGCVPKSIFKMGNVEYKSTFKKCVERRFVDSPK